MNAAVVITGEHAKSESLLRTLALCDLVDSTALVERLGDQRAHDLFRQHDRIARDLCERHGGREIDKTDGFLLLFERPSQAVGFALAYQRALQALSGEVGEPMRARVAIHVGEVLVFENDAADVARGAKPLEVEGLAKPVAARLMGLARPGQILMSGMAHGLVARSHDLLQQAFSNLKFVHHGRFRCKGVPEPMPVYEVGQVGVAPLVRPPNSDKAWLERPLLLRPRALVAEFALAALAIVAIAWMTMRTQPAIAFAERDWVVIGDVRNLTGDSLYDASLDAAFRIGLEQSRFVNVVPDMQVRQALGRMKRDPKSAIDRVVGAEVAQRERARALIVATLAPSGREMRLMAEIIDPATTRTVATETIMVDDADAVIPATDDLVQRLRTTLGESIAQIEGSSLPLEKVTTPSIDALRAYSLSLRAVREGDFERATGLLKEATTHDADFALAYARMGANALSQNRPREARPLIAKALSLKDRLSKRELTYLQALEAMQTRGREAFAAWKVYADLYPDDAAGHNNAGFLAYVVMNDCKQAAPYYERASNLNHPLRAFANYCLGYCKMYEGDFESALRRFGEARDAGLPPRWMGLATAYLAAGRYDDASKFLDEGGRGPSEAHAGEGWTHRNALLVDQGDFAKALSTVRDGLADSGAATDVSSRWRLRAAELPLLSLTGDRATLARRVDQGLAELLAVPEADRLDQPFDYPMHVARWATWSARVGQVEAAETALAMLRDSGYLADYPNRVQAAAAIETEIALKRGDAERVLAVVARDAAEQRTFSLRVAHARALTATGSPQATAAWQSIATARGEAIAEWHDSMLGQAERLIDWNLSRLEVARGLRDKDPAAAKAAAEAFLAQWPSADDSIEPVKEAREIVASGSGSGVVAAR